LQEQIDRISSFSDSDSSDSDNESVVDGDEDQGHNPARQQLRN
jgi:hypothetical protein